MRLIFDGHMDLAFFALPCNRDLSRSAEPALPQGLEHLDAAAKIYFREIRLARRRDADGATSRRPQPNWPVSPFYHLPS